MLDSVNYFVFFLIFAKLKLINFESKMYKRIESLKIYRLPDLKSKLIKILTIYKLKITRDYKSNAEEVIKHLYDKG